MSRLSQSAAWQALHAISKISAQHMRDLFAADPQRFERFSLRFDGILVDYSKNRITEETMKLLVDLAREVEVGQWTERMFRGEKINFTEQRAVLHTALRAASRHAPVMVDGSDVMPDVRAVLEKMRVFSKSVRSGQWRGYTGKPITDVVNIGIGGSDLGPLMVCRGAEVYGKPEPECPFRLQRGRQRTWRRLIRPLDPETTLFIVASKTFTTQETLTNADHGARLVPAERWAMQRHVARHFVALSTNAKEVAAFGIDPTNMFEFWDWVGGRYSLWSAIGLSIALLVGMEQFRGVAARRVRHGSHFRTAPLGAEHAGDAGLARDLVQQLLRRRHPCDAALRSVPAPLCRPISSRPTWRATASASTATAVLVDYSDRAHHLGRVGTNGQHAFYQLIHQGTQMIPADFIAPVESPQSARRTSSDPAVELLRPDRGADARQDRGGGARRAGGAGDDGRHIGAAAAQGLPGQQPDAIPSCSAS